MAEPEIPRGQESRKFSAGAIATIVGIAILLVFIFQNTAEVNVRFLMLRFSWPLWLYTIAIALIGALVWFGLGVLRRHRRRVERRRERR